MEEWILRRSRLAAWWLGLLLDERSVVRDDQREATTMRTAASRPSLNKALETPNDTLRRWEDHGAIGRATFVSDTHAVVELCSCSGEVVDVLRSDNPALIAFLTSRLSSDFD